MRKWQVIDNMSKRITAEFFQEEEPQWNEAWGKQGTYTLIFMEATDDEANEYIENQWLDKYPPIEDFVHALVSERLNDTQPMKDYVQACAAVREALPLTKGKSYYLVPKKFGFFSFLKRLFGKGQGN